MDTPIAGLFAIASIALRNRSPNARYAAASAAMIGILASAAVTFWIIWSPQPVQAPTGVGVQHVPFALSRIAAPIVDAAIDRVAAPSASSADGGSAPSLSVQGGIDAAFGQVSAVLSWVVAGWFLGVLALLA